MKEILIFRTDRVGDLLFSLLFIKIIKLNFPHCRITLIASERNYEYAKTFKEIDNILLLKNNIFSKIKLIFRLKKIFTMQQLFMTEKIDQDSFLTF